MHMKAAPRATWAPGRGSFQGERVQLVLDRHPQQLVPGGVELDLVDAVAEAVVGAQLRRVLVGEAAERLRVLAAGEAPTAAIRSSAHSAPSRRTASTRGGSASKTL